MKGTEVQALAADHDQFEFIWADLGGFSILTPFFYSVLLGVVKILTMKKATNQRNNEKNPLSPL